MNFSIVVNNLLIIFLMIAVGFTAGKAGLLSEKASGDFTSFLMKVTLPCMIFSSMIREYDAALIRDSIIGIVLCFVMLSLITALCWWLSGRLGLEEWRRGTWMLSTTFGNSGFMGFPLALAIFGQDGLMLAAMIGISYMVLQYTVYIKIMCHFSGRGDAASVNWRQILLSNINIALGLGLLFFIFQIPVPSTLMTVLSGFGNITTPLSMFLIGLTLSKGRISEAFRDRAVLSCAAMRLLAIPAATAVFFRLVPVFSPVLSGVILLCAAMPCPSLGVIFSEEYGGDAQLGSQAIFLTSLFSIVTVPLMLMLL